MKYRLKALVVLFLAFTISTWSQNNVQIEQDLENLWGNLKLSYKTNINDIKSSGNTLVLDDLREQTNNFLLYAYNTSNYQLIDELAELYVETYDELSTFPNNKKQFILKGNLYYDDVSYYNQYWHQNSEKGADGYEHKNHTPAFLYLLAQTMNISTQIPDSDYNNLIHLKELNQKLFPVLRSIYYRWMLYDKSFQMERDGQCDIDSGEERFNFIDFIQKKLDNALGYKDNNKPVGHVNRCNALSNNELYIIAGIAEVLGAKYMKPDRFYLSGSMKSKFVTAFKLGNKLVKRNFREVYTKRESKKGLVLNAGADRFHLDYAFAKIESLDEEPCDFPKLETIEDILENDQFGNTYIGRDISHSRSLYPVLESLKNNKYLIDEQFPDANDILKVSNQFLYTVYNGNVEEPLFTNFYDGSNGWYRVHYGKHAKRSDETQYKKFGNGAAPFDFSSEAITAGYFFWKKYDSQHSQLRNKLYTNVIQKTGTPDEPNFVTKHYFKSYETEDQGEVCNSYRKDWSAGRLSMTKFQFYPTFFGDDRAQINNNTSHLITATVTNSYPHIYNSNFANTIGEEVYQSTFSNNPNNNRNYGEIINVTSGNYGNGEELLTAFYSTQGGVLVYKSTNDENPASGQLVYPFDTSRSNIIMESVDLDQNGNEELISAFRTKDNKTLIYRSHRGHPGSDQIIYPLNSYWEVIDMEAGNFEGENVLLTVFKHDDIFVITQSVKQRFDNGDINGFFGKEIYRDTIPSYKSINIETGDYNDDGKEELISAFIKKDDHVVNNETIAIYKNTEFKPGAIKRLPLYKVFSDIEMTSGDFDGDGIEELVSAFYNPNSARTSIYKSDGIPGTGFLLYTETPLQVKSMTVYTKTMQNESLSAIQQKRTLENQTNKPLIVFPNPNNGTFNVKVPNLSVKNLSIHNILGQKVDVNLEDGIQKTIKLKTKSKGWHIVRCSSNGEPISKSFYIK